MRSAAIDRRRGLTPLARAPHEVFDPGEGFRCHRRDRHFVNPRLDRRDKLRRIARGLPVDSRNIPASAWPLPPSLLTCAMILTGSGRGSVDRGNSAQTG